MPMIWIYRGQWPVHERLQNVSLEDAMRAESEGWGHRIEGMDGRDVVEFNNLPHPAADAYYARKTGIRTRTPVEPPPDGEDPADTSKSSGGATYPTREMRAEEPMRRKPGRPRKDESTWPES